MNGRRSLGFAAQPLHQRRPPRAKAKLLPRAGSNVRVVCTIDICNRIPAELEAFGMMGFASRDRKETPQWPQRTHGARLLIYGVHVERGTTAASYVDMRLAWPSHVHRMSKIAQNEKAGNGNHHDASPILYFFPILSYHLKKRTICRVAVKRLADFAWGLG